MNTPIAEPPWFFVPANYGPFCKSVDLNVTDYLSALAEVEAVFPIPKARMYTHDVMVRDGGLTAPFYLHPVPFTVLLNHPVQLFMSGHVQDAAILAEVIRLGRDLQVTRVIHGATSLRKKLSDLDISNYPGSLFEVELLADLVRAGLKLEIRTDTPDFVARLDGRVILVEAKHRGVRNVTALRTGLTIALALEDFRELRIALTSGLGGNNESVPAVVAQIAQDVHAMITSGARAANTPMCDIAHDPAATAKSISFSIKADYADELKMLVKSELEGKERALQKSSVPTREVAIVALDLRSAFPAMPEERHRSSIAPGWLGYYEEKIPGWIAAATEAAQAFIQQSSVIGGVLFHLRDARMQWPSKLDEIIHADRSYTLITRDQVAQVQSAADLRQGLNR